MRSEINKIYGNRVRVRVCGLLQNGQGLLLANHRSLTETSFWSPPGGGVEFGESVRTSLEREFYEETGLIVRAGDFRFMCEFIRAPLHAVELFFDVVAEGGELKTGIDPEFKSDEQLIQSVKFLSWAEVEKIPRQERHGVFNSMADPTMIMHLSGYVAV